MCGQKLSPWLPGLGCLVHFLGHLATLSNPDGSWGDQHAQKNATLNKAPHNTFVSITVCRGSGSSSASCCNHRCLHPAQSSCSRSCIFKKPVA